MQVSLLSTSTHTRPYTSKHDTSNIEYQKYVNSIGKYFQQWQNGNIRSISHLNVCKLNISKRLSNAHNKTDYVQLHNMHLNPSNVTEHS